jgi:hypothetical protein
VRYGESISSESLALEFCRERVGRGYLWDEENFDENELFASFDDVPLTANVFKGISFRLDASNRLCELRSATGFLGSVGNGQCPAARNCDS